jgi:hypothetical protein
MKYTIKDNGCWEFSGCKMPNGYGKVTVNKKTWLSHRYSYFLKNGEIPNGMHVCHTCDNRICINPEHLFLGTRKDNMQDMIKKKRNNFSGLRTNDWNEKANANKPRGENHWNIKHSDETINKIKKLAEIGIRQIDIAEMFGLRQGYISNVINNRVRKESEL